MKARRHSVHPVPSTIAGVEAMTLDSTHAFPRHSHDTFGIGVMLSGAQRSWSIVGAVQAQAGDAVMVNPGELHDGAPVGAARCWRIIYLDPAVVGAAIAEEADVASVTFRPVARDRTLALRIARLFEVLMRHPHNSLLREESLVGCLMRVVDRHDVRGARPVGNSPSIAKALRRLDEAPDAAVSLAELARYCDATRFQLLRGFAREVGTTPHAYLVQRRVRLARRLLALGVAPADAAARAGFADQSHMTRTFTRHFGITPGRYRAAAAGWSRP